MIDWILLIYVVVAFGWFCIGIMEGHETDLFTSLVFGLLWPLLWFIWLIRVVTDAVTY